VHEAECEIKGVTQYGERIKALAVYLNVSGTWGWYYVTGTVPIVGLILIDLATSISESSSNNPISVYPNPAKEYVNITSNENISSVKVMNPLGQLTAYNIPNSKIYRMNTSNLKAGVYFIQIQTSKETIIKKVNIIQ